MNVIVVGGGLTGSLIGFFLRRLVINLDLWESDQELGGRMKTFKTNQFSNGVDTGAQYITTNAKVIDHEVYSCLLKSHKIQPLNSDIINMKPLPSDAVNYIGTEGMESVVHHLINSSNFRNVYLSQPVKKLNIIDHSVEVVSVNGQKEMYDSVVLTLPVPVVLNLEGNFKNSIPKHIYEKLQKVKYSSRDCLMLFYDKKLPVNWAAKYIPHDEIFRYVAIQENKLGISSNQSSVVFHTSIQFGEKYKAVDDEIVKSVLLKHAQQLFREWEDPIEVQHYKWNYSQVLKPYENTPAKVILCTKPLIIIAGDGFTTSNVDGCITSAQSTADTVINSCTYYNK